MVDRFFRNVRTMRDAGASFAVEVTPHDDLIPQIESIKELVYREVGAWPHITVARDERDMIYLPLLKADAFVFGMLVRNKINANSK